MAIQLPKATWVRPPARDRLHKSRRALQVVTSLLFIIAPFVDLLRFDLKNGALILFATPFALNELYAVYLIVLVFILVVFAGALLYGRIYCGWMCPQTTLSELVASVERWVCKGRKGSSICKLSGPIAGIVMGAFVSASLVTYFLDPGDYFHPPTVAWVSWALSTLVIAAFLVILSHRFCLGICPYGILQNIIQDGRTLGVELDPARKDECTNCLLCVRACFMGVDIRQQAFDPRCLNCGDCIAATRLAKTCPDVPLIRYRYGNEPSRFPAWMRKVGLADARRVLVVALTLVVTGVMTYILASRTDLVLDIAAQYERTSADANTVRNVYRLSVGNRTDHPVKLKLAVEGLAGVSIEQPASADLEIAAGEHSMRDVVLTAAGDALEVGGHEIKVRASADGVSGTGALNTYFFVPTRR